MAKLLGCLFFLLFSLLLVVLLPFFHLGRFFFTMKRPAGPQRRSNTSQQSGRTSAGKETREDGKIFAPDEGEYVDFEEVKE